MKVTKTRLKQIIKEELTKIREHNLTEGSDVASDEQVAQAAMKLGYLLGGQPGVAAEVRDALAKTFPKAAESLYGAYQSAQMELDMIYSSYDQ